MFFFMKNIQLFKGQVPAFEQVKDKKCKSINKISKSVTPTLSNLNNFHSLEVVDRISETQLLSK